MHGELVKDWKKGDKLKGKQMCFEIAVILAEVLLSPEQRALQQSNKQEMMKVWIKIQKL